MYKLILDQRANYEEIEAPSNYGDYSSSEQAM